MWLSKLLATKIPTPWTEAPLSGAKFMTDDHKLSNATPTLNTDDTNADDLLPPPVLHTNAGMYHTRRMCHQLARFDGLAEHWASFKRRIGTHTAPSSSSQIGESAVESSYNQQMKLAQENDNVDEVVVDRVWREEIMSIESHSDHGAHAKAGESHQFNQGGSDHESLVYEGFWSMWPPLAIIRWQAWPFIMEIFTSRFIDQKSEQHYAQETWFLKKSLALCASLWLIVNWVLGCLFIPHNPVVLLDKIFYFGIAPVLSLPVVVMIMYDWPRDRPYIYQIFLIVSIWCWSFYQVIFIISCGFYSGIPNCQDRDFMAIFYYATALQTIALFGLKLNRFPAALGALVFFLFASIALIPARPGWARNMINFFIFHSFLIYVHYMRERSERRLYRLRDQLKIQYKATQKAQINERKASDSKRRLTSYVFHDMFFLPFFGLYGMLNLLLSTQVRVPLNTALLAVQNMEASGTVAKDQEIEFNALCGSLSMMSKVLNDVLDFNRMDSGKFESVSKPYAFHQVMRSLFVPLRLATDARGLQFETDLDLNIDRIARQAAYEAIGESMESIEKHIGEHPDVDGVVTGDETRLRQIITNLASNACKFTPSGGKLTIKTRLIIPTLPTRMDHDEIDSEILSEQRTDIDGDAQRPLSTDHLSQHNMQHDKPSNSLEWIAVRIEVTDTGYGIKRQDMVQSKLFSSFNQTEQGRQQGGKGTGLGLALVRQIVKLSGGRLGLQSKIGSGSTFWVELPLGVGRKTFIPGPDLPDTSSFSDLNTLNTRSGNVFKMPPLSDSVTVAVDAAALRASRKPSAPTRTISVMQGIMEQGGRVELVLKKQGYECPRDISDSSAQLIQTLPSQDVPEPPTELSQSPGEPETDPPDPAACNEPTVSVSPKPTTVQRPMFVPLPRRQIFSIDDLSQPPTVSTSNSDTGSPHLTVFDQYTHGSPSYSFPTTNIDPALNILVVDDDPLTRMLMKRILTRLGCVVSCAENGEVALEMILGQQVMIGPTPCSEDNRPILERRDTQISDESKYAVVFLDNQMPVMSGLRVVERLRALSRTDFIVGVTGNALLSDQEEYLEAGVDRVLTKPVLERSLKDILVLADEKRRGRLGELPL